MRRIIREEEPPRPSTRLGKDSPTTRSRLRASSFILHPSSFRELDWIVMKALEKDRRRRFETANDLAADVIRYLTDQPVEACPPSASYRLGKFARRNRAAITTTAVVGAALLAGTGVSLWQAARATKAEAKAEDRAEEARLIVDYLVRDVFGAGAPEKSHGRIVTVNDLLTMGEQAIPARFGKKPLAEASARQALGEALYTLGRYDEAARQFRKVAALRAKQLGPDHAETLAAEGLVVRALCPAGMLWSNTDEAEPLARRVLETSQRVFGSAHLRTLAAMTALARVLSAKQAIFIERLVSRYPTKIVPAEVVRTEGTPSMEVARNMLERAYAGQARTLGPEDPETLETLDVLGSVLRYKADFAGAEVVLRRAAEGRLRVLGPTHPATLQSQKQLAYALRRLGRTVEVTRLAIEVTEGHRQTFGPCHIQTSSALNLLLTAHKQAKDWAAIRDLCERWLRDILATPVEPDPYQSARRASRLSQMAIELATLPEPIPFDAALAIRAAQEAAELGDLRDNDWTRLGLIYLRAGDTDKAAQAIQTSMERRNGGDRFDWLVQAIIHARRGEMGTARAMYNRATQDDDRSKSSPHGIEYARAVAKALIDPNPPAR
jgi:tetratricopeptide (TPR) repeat protein